MGDGGERTQEGKYKQGTRKKEPRREEKGGRKEGQEHRWRGVNARCGQVGNAQTHNLEVKIQEEGKYFKNWRKRNREEKQRQKDRETKKLQKERGREGGGERERGRGERGKGRGGMGRGGSRGGKRTATVKN